MAKTKVMRKGKAGASIRARAQELLRHAEQAARTAETWIDLHNSVFGIGAKFSELFPTRADRVAYMKSPEHEKLRTLIDQVRSEKGDPAPLRETMRNANGGISVRIPTSIHAALLAEAEAEGVSLNQLCLAKLCVQLRAVV